MRAPKMKKAPSGACQPLPKRRMKGRSEGDSPPEKSIEGDRFLRFESDGLGALGAQLARFFFFRGLGVFGRIRSRLISLAGHRAGDDGAHASRGPLNAALHRAMTVARIGV